MSEESQRVLVIQDASRDVSYSAIKWTLQGLSLKPGDVVTLLGVLHHVNNPSTFSFMRGKLLGYNKRRISVQCLEPIGELLGKNLPEGMKSTIMMRRSRKLLSSLKQKRSD
ncbi:hypothetical protein RGQ29_016786 [Quercus rubra]|uniref:Uncharacterized protein n=1 Tax=Quercus rubra TaxID=3512 RepID=A0AAN7FF31_QUERU|nr:hypothetical protein RGQ29_016786 [Quercus rubra]